ncbi:limonene-1,2-epoxide hydrolase family protein [Rhizobium tropici]|uniref:limonene-1,2-epoxide hydrolase family protein n=1 Tax=Rhizobium tropici TaxID=398 RepID=UPI0032B10CF3
MASQSDSRWSSDCGDEPRRRDHEPRMPFGNVRKFHMDFGLGTAFTVDWEVVNIAVSGNVVLNERIDVFNHTSGGKITLPVMGTITVVGDKISVWRDYFDPPISTSSWH